MDGLKRKVRIIAVANTPIVGSQLAPGEKSYFYPIIKISIFPERGFAFILVRVRFFGEVPEVVNAL